MLVAKFAPKRAKISVLEKEHNAPGLSEALFEFVVEKSHRSRRAAIERELGDEGYTQILDNMTLEVFYIMRMTFPDIQVIDEELRTHDALHVGPERFDCLLVNETADSTTGVLGAHAAQAKIIFKLPKSVLRLDSALPTGPLIYVQWFSRFPEDKSQGQDEASAMHFVRVRETPKAYLCPRSSSLAHLAFDSKSSSVWCEESCRDDCPPQVPQ
jgi:hypothetical protein